MSLSVAITYAPQGEEYAKRLAQDLERLGYTLSDIDAHTIVIALLTEDAPTTPDWVAVVNQALQQPTQLIFLVHKGMELPPEWATASSIQLAAMRGYEYVLLDLQERLGYMSNPPVETPHTHDDSPIKRQRANARLGWGVALVAVILFGLYISAIVFFDIESPQEEFELLYTRDAATINYMAQTFVPRTTEDAQLFEQRLSEGVFGENMATIVVATATQIARDGGFTPIPEGLNIAPTPISEVRQLATDTALATLELTEQAQQEAIRIEQTATAAAVEAQATLDNQLLTVTAVATSE